MSYLREMDLGETSQISVSLREVFGFVPNVFRVLGLLSRIPEALSGLATAVILPEQALTRIRKQSIMLAVAAAYRNVYCVAWHHRSLRLLGVPDSQLNRIISDHHHGGLSRLDAALLDFGLKLATRAPWLSARDICQMRVHGFTNESILEAIIVTAMATLFCTLSAGLGPPPDFDPPAIPEAALAPMPDVGSFVGGT